jgi:hypothetical protein
MGLVGNGGQALMLAHLLASLTPLTASRQRAP